MRGEEVGDVTGVAVHLLGAFLVATNEGSKVYLLPTSMSLQSISYDFDMRVKARMAEAGLAQMLGAHTGAKHVSDA